MKPVRTLPVFLFEVNYTFRIKDNLVVSKCTIFSWANMKELSKYEQIILML